MPKFHFEGKATLNGVDFYIMADTIEEAVARAKRGEFDLTEDYAAEMTDWEIDETSGRENK